MVIKLDGSPIFGRKIFLKSWKLVSRCFLRLLITNMPFIVAYSEAQNQNSNKSWKFEFFRNHFCVRISADFLFEFGSRVRDRSKINFRFLISTLNQSKKIILKNFQGGGVTKPKSTRNFHEKNMRKFWRFFGNFFFEKREKFSVFFLECK